MRAKTLERIAVAGSMLFGIGLGGLLSQFLGLPANFLGISLVPFPPQPLLVPVTLTVLGAGMAVPWLRHRPDPYEGLSEFVDKAIEEGNRRRARQEQDASRQFGRS